MSTKQISIQISPATLNALMSGGFNLYAFKAAQIMGRAYPLVWYATRQFANTTIVSWEEQYQAYTSNSQIMPGATIMMSFTASINTGMTLEIQPSGSGNVVLNGQPGAITIMNRTPNPFTVGIAQQVGGRPNASCALQLYGNMNMGITPVEKVLLMFASQPMNTGEVVDRSPSNGLLIDMTTSNQQTVNFDINTGWSGAAGQPVPAGTSLSQLLFS